MKKSFKEILLEIWHYSLTFLVLFIIVSFGVTVEILPPSNAKVLISSRSEYFFPSSIPLFLKLSEEYPDLEVVPLKTARQLDKKMASDFRDYFCIDVSLFSFLVLQKRVETFWTFDGLRRTD